MSIKIYGLEKDKRTRYFWSKNELNMIAFKYIISSDLSKEYKQYIYHKFLKKFHLNSSQSRIVNRCVFCSRSHWILREFRVTRMTFRDYADFGNINGVRRASW